MYSVSTLEAVITNRKIDANRQKVSWFSTHEIHSKKDEPTTLFIRNSIAQEDSQKVDIMRARIGRRASLKDVPLH
ncbi:hypothetical protein PR048_013140 [Dryococelus australis]|uniref:Uncharacterized protein n=1 Tax=Dryococelus australis TaxID=614101 RepID=A0ABQ9HS68_9NEOP|nr:hypothetical protein PR048_013140 [Dryococelus australis]